MTCKFAARMLGVITLSSLLGGAAMAEEWRGWNIHPEGYPNT